MATPTTLATIHPWAKGIAVDAGFVYWTDWHDNSPGTLATGRVGRATIDGGSVTILAEARGLPGPIAVHNGFLFWLAPEQVRRMNLDGTENQLLASPLFPTSLAIDARAVYFNDAKAGTVNSVPLAGGAVSVLASGLQKPVGIAVDLNDVVFSEWPEGAPESGTVSRVPMGGGPVTVTATGQDRPRDLTVDDADVYWNTSGAVHRAPLAGGPTTLVARAPSGLGLSSFWLDTDYLYLAWIGEPGKHQGGVGRVLRGTDALETLATGQAGPDKLIADATNLYWLNLDPGAILRLPKTAPAIP